MQTTCKFYLWLNVSSILYNEELRKITVARDAKRLENIQLGGKYPDFEHDYEENDYKAPIHFPEF